MPVRGIRRKAPLLRRSEAHNRRILMKSQSLECYEATSTSLPNHLISTSFFMLDEVEGTGKIGLPEAMICQEASRTGLSLRSWAE